MPDGGPPKYPRIPHLLSSAAATRDDIVLSADGLPAFVGRDVVVEEKLDGSNVTVWVDGGMPRVATRGGVGAADRAGILGPVRRWAATHADALRNGLGDRYAVYGEWLQRRHVIAYDRLPGPFVGFDVLDRASDTFLSVEGRDRVLRAAEIPLPPRLFTGRLTSVGQLDGLFGRSAWGASAAEGVVVRSAHGDRQLAKLVDPRWAGIGDAPWSGDPYSNRVLARTG